MSILSSIIDFFNKDTNDVFNIRKINSYYKNVKLCKEMQKEKERQKKEKEIIKIGKRKNCYNIYNNIFN